MMDYNNYPNFGPTNENSFRSGAVSKTLSFRSVEDPEPCEGPEAPEGLKGPSSSKGAPDIHVKCEIYHNAEPLRYAMVLLSNHLNHKIFENIYNI